MMANLYAYNANVLENDADGNAWVGFDGTDWQYLYGGDGYPVAKYPSMIAEHDAPAVLDSMTIGRFANAAGRAKFHQSPRSYAGNDYGNALNMLLGMCMDDGDQYEDVIALMKSMEAYGASALHVYEEGISVSELDYLRKLSDKQLSVLLALLRVDSMYRSREARDADNGRDDAAGDIGSRIFQRLPWVPECTVDAHNAGEKLIVVDYPVFTGESIGIMKIFGMKRMYDFVAGTDRMNHDANGCTREQVYDVIRRVIDSGSTAMADCLLTVIKHCTGSAPVITSDVMTIEWVRNNSAIPTDIISDNLDSGMYTETGISVEDMYYEVLDRIMGTLDDTDIDTMGIDSGESRLVPPNARSMTIAEYAHWLSDNLGMVRENHISIMDKYQVSGTKSITLEYHKYDGLERIARGTTESPRELNHIASKYLTIGLMRNRYSTECTLGDESTIIIPTGKLLNRFMGYVHTIYIDNNNDISTAFINRITNVLGMILELDDESFAMLADIRCTAYGPDTSDPYIQTPVWFQDEINMHRPLWQRMDYVIVNELKIKADESLFPMGMNRMLGILGDALAGGTTGIKRLDTLCRSIIINDTQYNAMHKPTTRYGKSMRGSKSSSKLRAMNPYRAEHDWLTKGKPITKVTITNDDYLRSSTANRTIDLTKNQYWLAM